MENQQRHRIRRKDDRELEVQFELLKIIAEQNKEILVNIDVELDKAILYEVRNGDFNIISSYDEYFENVDTILDGLSERDKKLFIKALDKCLMKESHEVFEVQFPNRKGNLEWYRVFLASIGEVEGEISTIAGRLISVHKEKIATETMRHRAEIDALTGVYNHISFESACEKKLCDNQSEMLFLMMDVDDFKMINDSLGHNVGDLVLCQTGNVLRETIGERGFAGRLGGDEFAILVWGFDGKDEILEFCEKLQSNLKKIIFDMEYSASMGVSIRHGRDMTFKDMYYEADQAVYSAKKSGKNQIVFYDEIKETNDTTENVVIQNNKFTDAGTLVLHQYDKFVMDQRPEYVFLISPATKRILYVNRSAQDAMLHKDEKWKEFYCYDLFRGCDKECSNCSTKGENYYVSYEKNRKTDTFSYYFGECDFLIHMLPVDCYGESIIVTSAVNLGDSKHINAVMRKRAETLNAVKRCMEYLSSQVSEIDYNKGLQQIADFYDADSVFLVDYNEGAFDRVIEVHKPTVEMMVSVVKQTIESGGLSEFRILAEDSGEVVLVDTKSLEDKNPNIYKRLVDCRIWSIASKRLFEKGENAGLIILLNPRSNVHEPNILELLSAYLTGDMLRARLERLRDYDNSHDKLTGLWNRSRLKDVRWNWKNDEYHSLGVFAADIIHLKEINKEFNYQVGNDHILQLKDAMESVFKGYDMYRFDDELLVVCPNVELNFFKNMINWVTEKIIEQNLPVATGYSWSSDVNINEQITEAEDMVIVDKENQSHKGDFDERKSAKISMDIQKEIIDGNFMVYMQPKVNIETDETVGAEALIRLKHPDFGIVGPAFYIDLLEEQNIVHLIDLFVLEKVCEFQQLKYRSGNKTVPISVNFSKKTLVYADLIKDVRRIMERYDLPQGLIQIEITETIGDMDHLLVSNIANSLRSMGFILAMDDFGTKYSNLSMLFKFQFSIAKVDRSLVREITTNKKSSIILRHIIEMFNELEIECVVEGAETQEQIDLLKDMNCKIVQGFFYGKPVAIDEFYDKFMA